MKNSLSDLLNAVSVVLSQSDLQLVVKDCTMHAACLHSIFTAVITGSKWTFVFEPGPKVVINIFRPSIDYVFENLVLKEALCILW